MYDICEELENAAGNCNMRFCCYVTIFGYIQAGNVFEGALPCIESKQDISLSIVAAQHEDTWESEAII